MPYKKDLDLYVEVDVLTAGTIAEVVNAILETLLYQRNQIPFVYKTYRYFVNKWKQQDESQLTINGEGNNVKDFQIERKKQQATTTKEAISSMREIIKSIFEKKSIKSLRFLFGSTIFTAKEAYTVHIPTENIAVNHFYDNHKISQDKLNQTLLSLLTSNDLYPIFSHNLNATNIYLELELLEEKNVDLLYRHSDIFPKDFLQLPFSCKDIHIHLLHKQSPTFNHKDLKCCKELQVYNDLIRLSLKSSDERQNDIDIVKNDKSLTNFISAWWEAEIFIRGFKDQPTKGFNIWS